MTSQAPDFQSLAALLPGHTLLTRPGELLAYEIDAGLDRGLPQGVIFPESAADVSRIVRWAGERGVPLVARGAGTGISGGAVAECGGLILEFARLNRILAIDAAGRRAVVQPGVVNQALDLAARRHGFCFPPDPASGRSATIGGNIAENAGGPHCFKYGVTTNYVLGLEVVLADGVVVQLGGPAVDYPDYDLAGLLTGSEGTLGIITEATVRLLPDPPGVRTLLAAFPTLEAAGTAVSAVIAAGLVPAAMEMMDRQLVRIIEDYAHAGLPLEAAAVIIIEVDGRPESLDRQIAELIAILQANGAGELQIAHSAAQREQIWRGRKSAAGAIARLAPAYYSVDVTVPRSKLAWALHAISGLCEEAGLHVGYVLHAGDGNLHPDILVERPDDPTFMARVHQAARRMVELCVAEGGTITGEHGVGIEKRSYMALMFSPDELAVMQEVKAAFDPRGVLNPGKIFPEVTARPHGEGRSVAPACPAGGTLVPASAAEVAAILAGCCAGSPPQPLRIRGGGTKSGDPAPGETVLSTRALAGIRVCAPDDLYVTAAAGTPLAELQAALAGTGRWVPLVSPWSDATLGGVVATNFNAPLRLRYGAIRDLVLAATVVLPDGRTIRAGRPLVKNVAGYDLPKLFVGARGTLGLMTDITFKLVARPRDRQTFVAPVADLAAGLAGGVRLLQRCLVASAVLLCSGRMVEGVTAPHVLVCTVEGLADEVTAERDVVARTMDDAGLAPAGNDGYPTGSELWTGWIAAACRRGTLLRIGAAPGHLAGIIALLPAGADFIADLATGLLYTGYAGPAEDLVAARLAARACGGYALTLAAPSGQPRPVDYEPPAGQVMAALKRQWDPAGMCNP